jgi:hypothetical protein
MRNNYKGFKENPLILTEKKIYEHLEEGKCYRRKGKVISRLVKISR